MIKRTQVILTDKEISEIIRNHVVSHGYSVDQINFEIMDEKLGYGPSALIGATVTVKEKSE